MQNLTVDQILERLNPHFHDDFLNKTSKIIRPDEKYWGIGNWSQIDRKEFLGPPELAVFGYILITSYRVIKVFFEEGKSLISTKRERINITTAQAAFKEINLPLTEKEVKSRQLFETPLKKLHYVRHEEIFIEHNSSSNSLIFIFTGNDYGMYFDNKNAGMEIYNLLVDIIHGTPTQMVEVPNLAEQLEKLTDLHRYQVITDEEYEAAKKRLGL